MPAKAPAPFAISRWRAGRQRRGACRPRCLARDGAAGGRDVDHLQAFQRQRRRRWVVQLDQLVRGAGPAGHHLAHHQVADRLGGQTLPRRPARWTGPAASSFTATVVDSTASRSVTLASTASTGRGRDTWTPPTEGGRRGLGAQRMGLAGYRALCDRLSGMAGADGRVAYNRRPCRIELAARPPTGRRHAVARASWNAARRSTPPRATSQARRPQPARRARPGCWVASSRPRRRCPASRIHWRASPTAGRCAASSPGSTCSPSTRAAGCCRRSRWAVAQMLSYINLLTAAAYAGQFPNSAPPNYGLIEIVGLLGTVFAVVAAGWIGWQRPWLFGLAASIAGTPDPGHHPGAADRSGPASRREPSAASSSRSPSTRSCSCNGHWAR